FQSNVLRGFTLLILIVAAAHGGVREVCLRTVISQGESQRKTRAISRISEMKNLAESFAQAGPANQQGRNSGIELVANDAVARVEAREFQVRFEKIVGETNAQLIAGQLLARGLQFRAVGEGAGQRGRNVRGWQGAEWLGLIGKLQIESADSGIQIGADNLPKLILGLLQRVFRLDEAHAP